jgi:hypothetical protein
MARFASQPDGNLALSGEAMIKQPHHGGATPEARFDGWNESRTKRARIADSRAVLFRSLRDVVHAFGMDHQLKCKSALRARVKRMQFIRQRESPESRRVKRRFRSPAAFIDQAWSA